MAVSEKAWSNITAADYADAAAYCRASLIDLNEPGADKAKGLCKLPVYEPGGDLNRAAVHAVAAVLAGGRGGVDAPTQAKRAAARKLVSLYGQLEEPAPDTITRLARG